MPVVESALPENSAFCLKISHESLRNPIPVPDSVLVGGIWFANLKKSFSWCRTLMVAGCKGKEKRIGVGSISLLKDISEARDNKVKELIAAEKENRKLQRELQKSASGFEDLGIDNDDNHTESDTEVDEAELKASLPETIIVHAPCVADRAPGHDVTVLTLDSSLWVQMDQLTVDYFVAAGAAQMKIQQQQRDAESSHVVIPGATFIKGRKGGACGYRVSFTDEEGYSRSRYIMQRKKANLLDLINETKKFLLETVNNNPSEGANAVPIAEEDMPSAVPIAEEDMPSAGPIADDTKMMSSEDDAQADEESGTHNDSKMATVADNFDNPNANDVQTADI